MLFEVFASICESVCAVEDTELADRVLGRLIRASNNDPRARFTVSKSIDRTGSFRISFPGGRFNAQPELIENLLERKLVQVISERAGTIVIGVTVRGFDYHARRQTSE
jgi:hypothetical protein